ncbi:MAG TPA: hypothetical protein VI670_26805 [Thermoanaerobaculia bacterium]|jgi:hypothetical protein
MTTEAKHLIEEFEALSDAAKQEVLVEILRIANDIDYPELTDEDLTAVAAETFALYDAEEDEK